MTGVHGLPACLPACLPMRSANGYLALPLLLIVSPAPAPAPAGLAGLLLALACQQQRALAPLANLRHLNPYVASALGDSRGRQGLAVVLPRQAAPHQSVHRGSVGPAAGTSSFGMSGINAHLLLSAAGAAWQVGAAHGLAWQRQRHWPAPQPHPLLHSCTAGMDGSLQFSCSFAAARMAFVWDHRVAGRIVLPPTCLLELLHAAARTASGAGAQLLLSLAGVVLAAPVSLQQLQQAGGVVVSVQSGSGAASVAACDGASLASCSVAGAVQPAQGWPVGARVGSFSSMLGSSSKVAQQLARPVGSSIANLAACSAGGTGWQAHPAEANAALCLAAAGSASIVTAVAAVLTAAAEGTSNNMCLPAWCAGAPAHTICAQLPGSSVGFAAADVSMTLAAVHIDAAAEAAAAAAGTPAYEQAHFTYQVQWQAAEGATVLLPATCSGGCTASLSPGSGLLASLSSGGTSSLFAPAAGIAVLQSALAGSQAPVLALVRANVAAAPGASSRGGCEAGAVLEALLKVAALEHPHRSWATLAVDRQQQPFKPGPTTADQHGCSVAAGAAHRPKLLRHTGLRCGNRCLRCLASW